MFRPLSSFNCIRPHVTPRGATSLSVLIFAFSGFILSGPVRAADSPEAAPPGGEKPAPSPNPGSVLNGLADELDKKPDFVVLKLENLLITQADVAGVVRAMPPAMASLGFKEVYRRAMDITVRQKAMVLRARLEKLDKDPVVIRETEIASERVLADAWLKRRADLAVTDQALHVRYDRDIAGKPGPEEVRARVILVPTEAEATKLIENLRDGADFAELAHQVSKDPSASNGGDLGYVGREAVLPEVSAAMFALAPGQTTPYPVASRVGFFVIKVEGRWRRATPTFDEARPALERDLRSEAIQAAIETLLSNVKFVAPVQPGQQAQPARP
jgi:peptidyl-prolyl cis-trans isomerase C